MSAHSIIDKHINQIPQEDPSHKVHVIRGNEQPYKHNNRFYCQLCYFSKATHIFLKWNKQTKIWTCPLCLYEIDTTLNQLPIAKDDVIATNDPLHSSTKPHIVPMKHFNIIQDKGTEMTDQQLANEERNELDLPEFGNPSIIYHTSSEAFADMDKNTDQDNTDDDQIIDEEDEDYDEYTDDHNVTSKMVKVY